MRSTTLPSTPLIGMGAPIRDAGSGSMRFGAFQITETQSFPPETGEQCWVYLTLNAEIALSLPESTPLQRLIQSPRVRISVDGQWIWWALRRKYPGRWLRKLSGSDLIHDLAAHCGLTGQRLLLLGSSPGASAAAVQALRQRWPGLDVAGYAPPCYVADDSSEASMQTKSLAAIQAYRPDYVVLGLGAAKEQRFALQMMAQLDGRVSGLFCFGGAIDLAGGAVRRAPRPWQLLGVEGIYRVLQQPSRAGRLVKVLRVLPLLMRGRY
jgi:exopolysaccharide biosynthesis WecB/TagA/CpsF family protein